MDSSFSQLKTAVDLHTVKSVEYHKVVVEWFDPHLKHGLRMPSWTHYPPLGRMVSRKWPGSLERGFLSHGPFYGSWNRSLLLEFQLKTQELQKGHVVRVCRSQWPKRRFQWDLGFSVISKLPRFVALGPCPPTSRIRAEDKEVTPILIQLRKDACVVGSEVSTTAESL